WRGRLVAADRTTAGCQKEVIVGRRGRDRGPAQSQPRSAKCALSRARCLLLSAPAPGSTARRHRPAGVDLAAPSTGRATAGFDESLEPLEIAIEARRDDAERVGGVLRESFRIVRHPYGDARVRVVERL